MISWRHAAQACVLAASVAMLPAVATAQCARPGNLSATDGAGAAPCTPSPMSTFLSWNAVPDATAYRVYRNTVNASGTDSGGMQIGVASTNSFSDTTGTPFVTYWYSVRALGPTCGEQSPVSFTDSGYRLGLISAPAPTISPSVQTCAGVTLTWAGMPGSTGYDVGRSTTPDGSIELIGSTLSFVTEFTDSAGIPGRNYYYFLRGKSLCGVGPWSSTPPVFPNPTRGNRSGPPAANVNPFVPSPLVQLSTTPYPHQICPGATVGVSIPLPVLGAPSFTDNGGDLRYQWRCDGEPIDGIANPTALARSLVLQRFAMHSGARNGVYDCDVSNDCGSVTSPGVTVRTCRADFDCAPPQRDVDADDIFAFLDAWFPQSAGASQSPRSADYTDDGLVDADDIFAFLDAWFEEIGHCP